ncbi:MAG: CinA family protein [Thiohalorhabdus sp.]|uniref:CinA family protein n=1 Tax=Thiohalorhabdus sp. TaxID=3094134 RepID=UPI0039803952
MPGQAVVHVPGQGTEPWLAARLARLRTLVGLSGFAVVPEAARPDLRVTVAPNEGPGEGQPVRVDGLAVAEWSREEGTLAVRIRQPELAEEALVAALAAAGLDPRRPGRFAAVAPDEEGLRARLPEGATLTPGLPGEWWVGDAAGARDPWLDPGLRSPERYLGRRLAAAGRTIATAESCTGGGVAERLTAVPGSSAYVERGWVTYTNAAKEALLGVPGGVLERHGAVSEPVARAMVQGALERAPAHLALAVTGIAGPGGGTAEKPVGTVWIGAGRCDAAPEARRFVFPGTRGEVRWRTVNAAIALALELVD